MEQKVSIIVPVYNAEKYLGYTISSMIQQSYQNLEIILVNDGSKDQSLGICRNYAAIDPRIRVIDMPNGGVSAARNRGLQEAAGEYVQFVDSDDVIHVDMTKKLVEAMETYQTDIVICGFWIIELDEKLEKRGMTLFSSRCLGRECVLTKDMFFQNMAFILWNSSLLEGPCNRLYRRKVIEKHQLQFPADLSLGEDFCFNMDYFRDINGVVFLDEPYYYYLKTGSDSLTGCYRANLFDNQLYLVQRFEKLLKDYGEIGKEQERQLAHYMTAKAVQAVENFFRKECTLELAEKKRRIAEILNHSYVRKAFETAESNYLQYEWIKEKVQFSDVEGICSWIENQRHHAECNRQAEEKNRGVLNCCIVGCCDAVLKKIPVVWLEVLRECMCEDGIKRTLKKILEYLQ